MCSHESVWVVEESKQKLWVSEASSVSITTNKSLGPTLSSGSLPLEPTSALSQLLML